MKRRAFIAALGGAAVLPLAARAQQALPVVGFLGALSQGQSARQVEMFLRGLGETGFTAGRNVAVEYRFADGRYERLPALASELVGRSVQVLVAQSPPAALAAKAATTTIPIVFSVGVDPVAAGLVASFNRPGGNATGTVVNPGPVAQKRLELVRELAPKAADVALLVNPSSGGEGAAEISDVRAAAQANGVEVRVLNASTPGEIDAAFAALAERRPGALLVGGDPFFMLRRQDIITHVARSGLVAIYPFREFTESGGLISYGINLVNGYRQVGIYTGRILKGARPDDLPVVQPTVLELVINLGTARVLGLEIPPLLHARSNDVIE
jgi:putative ABC transport system substrate-binding protein